MVNDKNLETVKVKHDDGYMVINKADFNPDVHEEYKETNQTQEKLNKDAKPARRKKEQEDKQGNKDNEDLGGK